MPSSLRDLLTTAEILILRHRLAILQRHQARRPPAISAATRPAYRGARKFLNRRASCRTARVIGQRVLSPAEPPRLPAHLSLEQMGRSVRIRGGHFAAWEQPELFSAEIRAAFRSLR